jgi:F-type H+-transporting ATPase subunit alpha
MIIYAGTNGYCDSYPVEVMARFEQQLFEFLENKHPDILKNLKDKKELKPDIEDSIKKALEEFKGIFQA